MKPGPKATSRYCRLSKHIQKTDNIDDCWEWNGKTDTNGYGVIHEGRKSFFAHRVTFFLYKGSVPANVLIRHSCDNPPCCNPNHLLSGSHDDNAKDMVSRNRQAKGETSSRVKLTSEEVSQIRELSERGHTNRELGDKFGVVPSNISKINKRKLWK